MGIVFHKILRQATHNQAIKVKGLIINQLSWHLTNLNMMNHNKEVIREVARNELTIVEDHVVLPVVKLTERSAGLLAMMTEVINTEVDNQENKMVITDLNVIQDTFHEEKGLIQVVSLDKIPIMDISSSLINDKEVTTNKDAHHQENLEITEVNMEEIVKMVVAAAEWNVVMATTEKINEKQNGA